MPPWLILAAAVWSAPTCEELGVSVPADVWVRAKWSVRRDVCTHAMQWRGRLSTYDRALLSGTPKATLASGLEQLVRDIRTMSHRYPNEPIVVSFHGRLALRQGRANDARRDFEEIRHREPSLFRDIELQLDEARAKKETGDVTNACALQRDLTAVVDGRDPNASLRLRLELAIDCTAPAQRAEHLVSLRATTFGVGRELVSLLASLELEREGNRVEADRILQGALVHNAERLFHAPLVHALLEGLSDSSLSYAVLARAHEGLHHGNEAQKAWALYVEHSPNGSYFIMAQRRLKGR